MKWFGDGGGSGYLTEPDALRLFRITAKGNTLSPKGMNHNNSRLRGGARQGRPARLGFAIVDV
jgi:hypothetical protein